jgi:hypothetical protein
VTNYTPRLGSAIYACRTGPKTFAPRMVAKDEKELVKKLIRRKKVNKDVDFLCI